MKKILSLLLTLAVFTSCSDDDDTFVVNPDFNIDSQQIRSYQLYDVTGGDTLIYADVKFLYDEEGRLAKVNKDESTSKGSETKVFSETVFSYKGGEITYTTIDEGGNQLDLHRGSFSLNGSGVAVRGRVEHHDQTATMKFDYNGSHYLSKSIAERGRDMVTVALEWDKGNIILTEMNSRVSDGTKGNEFERIEYTIYPNDALLDLAQIVCFEGEGGQSLKNVHGVAEGNYLGCFSHRVKNMPSKITTYSAGVKSTKTFEYSRDRNNRIYEIGVKTNIVYNNKQEENKEYKYVIVY